MKKLALIAILFSILHIAPSQALPGWSGEKLQEWAKSHSFISPKIDEIHTAMTIQYQASRDIQNDKRVIVRYSQGILSYERRAQIPLANVELYVIENNDDSKRTPGIWFRESQKAKDLLTNIYSDSIWVDFSTSKKVLQKMDYGYECGRCSERDKIHYTLTDPESMWEIDEVNFYLGNNFFYEANSKMDTLIIRPVARVKVVK